MLRNIRSIKGILPPIMAETPKRAIKFFCFGSYNAYLSRNTSLSNAACGSIAGLGSGLTEGFFITPFERVKILLQNQKGSLKGTIRCSMISPLRILRCNFLIFEFLEATSAGTQAKEVIRQYGLGTKGGLFTGCTATLGLFSSFQNVFSLFEL